MTISIPWPARVLSPNDRSHWTKKSKAKASYKETCKLLALANVPKLPQGRIHLRIVFHPPSMRAFDLDNALASIKSGLDGIADAWGVNDKMFRPITVDFGDKVDGGTILIFLEG